MELRIIGGEDEKLNDNRLRQILDKILPYTFLNNFGMGLIKIIGAIITMSLGLLISSFYNFILSIAKKKIFSKKQIPEYKRYFQTGLLIIISGVIYIIYSILLIKLNLSLSYHMYAAILIAAITFTDITMSIIGIIKAKKNKDIQSEMLKYINLSTALISLSLTQSAILSFTNPNNDNSFVNGSLGIMVAILTILIGIYMMLNSKKKNYLK